MHGILLLLANADLSIPFSSGRIRPRISFNFKTGTILFTLIYNNVLHSWRARETTTRIVHLKAGGKLNNGGGGIIQIFVFGEHKTCH